MRHPDTAIVAAIARQAGAAIVTVRNAAELEVKRKLDRSPVTAADMAAHDIILAELNRLTPGVPVISEEDLPANAAEVVAKSEACWLVDPLDGTRDFVAGSRDFTVNIAFMTAGRPTMGVVFAPLYDQLFVAANGGGAFRLDGDTPRPVRCRPVHPERPLALVSGMHSHGEKAKLAATFPQATIRRMGSSLKYVTVADGNADLALRYTPTSLWDTAAAQCVLEEAGGRLLDLAGAPLSYTHGSLVNPAFIAIGDYQGDVATLLAKLRL